VTVTAREGVYYDPYDVEINADPYLAFRGLREESPLYYNEQHDFYALSRFADVDRAICAWLGGNAGGSRLSQTQIRK